MKAKLFTAAFVCFMLGFIATNAYFHYKVFRLLHPEAPTWTFFFK